MYTKLVLAVVFALVGMALLGGACVATVVKDEWAVSGVVVMMIGAVLAGTGIMWTARLLEQHANGEVAANVARARLAAAQPARAPVPLPEDIDRLLVQFREIMGAAAQGMFEGMQIAQEVRARLDDFAGYHLQVLDERDFFKAEAGKVSEMISIGTRSVRAGQPADVPEAYGRRFAPPQPVAESEQPSPTFLHSDRLADHDAVVSEEPPQDEQKAETADAQAGKSMLEINLGELAAGLGIAPRPAAATG